MARYEGSVSFDIEDWYHSELIPGRGKLERGASVASAGTGMILDLLKKHEVRATFFVLGEVVRDHPEILHRLVDEGHEVASHGLDHQPLWNLNRESFRTQLREFRAIVEGILGHFPVTGFRAPCFSLDRTTTWALDVLREEGYAYDSSIFPARVKMYGVPDAPVGIYRPARTDIRRHDPQEELVEFPVAVCRVGPLRVPTAGGFYLRVLPLPVLRLSLDLILRRRPFALYLHPREFKPEETRLPLGPVNAFISYVNLKTVAGKLERLLERYPFVPMREVLERQGWLPMQSMHRGVPLTPRRAGPAPCGSGRS